MLFSYFSDWYRFIFDLNDYNIHEYVFEINNEKDYDKLERNPFEYEFVTTRKRLATKP